MKKTTQAKRTDSNIGSSNRLAKKSSNNTIKQNASQKNNNESLNPIAIDQVLAVDEAVQEGTEEIDDEADFYDSLSHKVRRQIIKLIGTNKTASFTEIKKATNLSTGVVYHHLDHLSKLIERDEKKRYYLTKLGEHAFRFIDINTDSIEAKKYEENVSNKNQMSPIYQKLSLNPLLNRLIEKPKIYWPISILLLSILIIFTGLTQMNSFLFFFFDTLPNDPDWGPYISPFLSTIFGVCFIEIIIRVLFKRKEDYKKLIGLFAFCFIPSIIYLSLILLFFSGESSEILSFFQTLLMIVFQVWSLMILMNLLVRLKNIKMERAIFTVVLLVYFSFTVLLIARSTQI